MKQAILEHLVLGEVQTNVWLLMNRDTRELIIIDPSDRADRIEAKIAQMEGKPAAILLTHGHYDHMLAADDLRDFYGIPIYAPAAEKELLENAQMNLSGSWAKAHVTLADHFLVDKSSLELAGFSVEMLHTPGHTAGSSCYYIAEEELLISGDTLFAGSVGRMDLPTGSGASMRQSIARLLTLPEETRVCPGHGSETSIAYEKRYNPFA